MNIRMLPPATPGTIVVNGRTYSATPGTAVDVPDFDAFQLGANGWVNVAPSGPTSARPTNRTSSAPYVAGPSFQFYDVTISKLIVFDGATWRDPATGNAV